MHPAFPPPPRPAPSCSSPWRRSARSRRTTARTRRAPSTTRCSTCRRRWGARALRAGGRRITRCRCCAGRAPACECVCARAPLRDPVRINLASDPPDRRAHGVHWRRRARRHAVCNVWLVRARALVRRHPCHRGALHGARAVHLLRLRSHLLARRGLNAVSYCVNLPAFPQPCRRFPIHQGGDVIATIIASIIGSFSLGLVCRAGVHWDGVHWACRQTDS